MWSDSYRGSQGCPFFLDGEVGDLSSDDTCGDTDRDWIIRNTALDEEIFISGLIVHLLRHHRFCEGHVKYRLDPGRAVRVLGIRRAEGGAAR